MCINSEKYTLTIDLATIDALGRNLYSNAAAVLSEFVANAWDADANNVGIDYEPKSGTIIVKDDGCGMSLDQMNSRFLTVGYRKRDTEGNASPRFSREFMGRKGIGKLSAFSLANRLQVISKQEGREANGFEIDVKKLENIIKSQHKVDYHPESVNEISEDLFPNGKGTQLKLSQLRNQRVKLTLNALRRRIARRFDVLNLSDIPPKDGQFSIRINGDPVTYEDRDDFKRLEYIWILDDYSLPDTVAKNAKRFHITDTTIPQHDDWRISGWIGTVRSPNNRKLNNEEENLKNIIVLARRRPIQEGLLDHIDFNKYFANYVTGQIRADFLDINDRDDIATSDRQRLVEDDERVIGLNDVMKKIFDIASDQWAAQRRTEKTKELVNNTPEVHEWLNHLDKGMKATAERMIERVSQLPEIEDADRRSLYQSSILAFTKLQRESEIKQLADLETLNVAKLIKILSSYNDYEGLEYAETVRQRISVIEKLEKLLDSNELENVTRDYIAENPWLLDPSWERATADLIKEKAFRRIAKDEFHVNFDDDVESNSRVDIKYLLSPDKQVIVEFKRYNRKIKIDEISKQINRYALAMTRLLRLEDTEDGKNSTFPANESDIDNRVNIIIIVKIVYSDIDGTPLSPAAANARVRPFNAKFLYFDNMINQSKKRYQEFINSAGEVDYAGNAIKALQGEE